MLTRTRATTRRRAFTLVELMVAAALAVVIMTILSIAFQTATDTLSHMKSVAGLAEQGRAVETVLLRDLQAQHLEDTAGRAVRVSTLSASGGKWTTADGFGYFSIYQKSQGTLEGVDPDAPLNDDMKSYQCLDHALQFTMKLPGGAADKVFTAAAPTATPADFTRAGISLGDYAPAGNVATQWAEVAYFLQAAGTATGTPVYTLYRQQKVVVPVEVNGKVDTAAYPEISVYNRAGNTVANTPETLTSNVNNRLDVGTHNYVPFPATSASYGADILATNVLSFQVKLLQDVNTGNKAYVNPGTAWPCAFDTNPAGALNHTNTAGKQPLGVQIRLRLYEPRNQMTRQLTLAADL